MIRVLLPALLVLLTGLAAYGGAAVPAVDQMTVCLECHGDLKSAFSAPNQHEVFSGGDCASCHNPHATKHEGMLATDQGALCAGCHEDTAGELELPVTHVPAAAGDCVLCHDPHASEFSGLKRAGLPDLCVQCHAPVGTWESRRFQHEPVEDGDCQTCHVSHGSEHDGLLESPVPDLCVECHEDSPEVLAAHSDRSLMATDCTACHDPHASDARGLLRSNRHKPFASGDCGTCHGDLDSGGSFAIAGTMQDLCLKCHRSVQSYTEATFKHNLETEESCVSCHSPHASNGEALLADTQAEICMSCHFNDNPGEKAKYLTHDGLDCVNCHLPHGGEDAQLLVTRGPELCAGCHESAHRVTHPIGPDVIDPRTQEAVNCLSCHQPHGADFEQYLPLNPDMALCVQCHNK